MSRGAEDRVGGAAALRPEARPAVGVKTALRLRPLPLSAPSVPPVTAMSLPMKLLPGSSLKAKVRVAVSADLSAALLLVISTVGATVSTATLSGPPTLPALPAASV